MNIFIPHVNDPRVLQLNDTFNRVVHICEIILLQRHFFYNIFPIFFNKFIYILFPTNM